MEESYAELVRKSEKYKTDRSDKQKEASKEFQKKLPSSLEATF